MALKRVFLTGSDRAEYEHVHGPFKVDENDPRFVLIDEETEEAVVKFPAGVPPQRGQSWPDVEKIRAAELAQAKDKQGNDGSPDSGKVHVGDGPDKAVAETGTPIKTTAPTYDGGKKSDKSKK